MSWALSRTEKLSRREPGALAPSRRGILHRIACAKPTQLIVRLACGLLAAMHVAPLLRVSRHVLEQGPTPALIATLAVLTLLIGVLTARAAGLVFFKAGSRRASSIALLLACAVFHGDVIASKDAAPTIAVLTTATTAVVAVKLGKKIHEDLKSRGVNLRDIFPNNAWALLDLQPALDPVALAHTGPRRPRGPPSAL